MEKEGLGDADAVSKANEEYRMDMDAVGTFVNDSLEIDGSLSWQLYTKILYETYIKWCNKNNERVMSQKWLGLRMNEKCFKRLSTNEQRVWLGLNVKVERRREKEVVIPGALPGSVGLTPGKPERVWKLITRTMTRS